MSLLCPTAEQMPVPYDDIIWKQRILYKHVAFVVGFNVGKKEERLIFDNSQK